MKMKKKINKQKMLNMENKKNLSMRKLMVLMI